MKIETNKVDTPNSQESVFDFLADLNNFQQLMPENKIENWESDKDSCQFHIKGMTTIGLKIVEKKPNSEIKIESFGKSPFKFNLNIFIEAKGDNAIAQMIFDGEVNSFMKMMIEKPLTNFFNMLTDKVAELKINT